MNTGSRLFASMIWKVLGIGVLSVLLLIPLALVLGLVGEREARRDEVVKEISIAWGQPQGIVGPMLVLPFTTSRTWVNSKTGEETRRDEEDLAYFVPEELAIAGSILPESRARGPFGVVVYSLPDLVVKGRFTSPDLAALRLDPAAVRWERAFLNGLDPRHPQSAAGQHPDLGRPEGGVPERFRRQPASRDPRPAHLCRPVDRG